MADVLTIPATKAPTSAAPPEPRKVQPVVLWAFFGAAVLIFEAYVLSDWVFSDAFVSTPAGPDQAPIWMEIMIRIFEYGNIPASAIFLWFVLVRPWRRQGRITFDGLLSLAFITLYWQDILANWIQPYFTYNGLTLNFGNWTHSVPGYTMPNGSKIPEGILLIFPMYTWMFFGAVMLGCFVMRKIRARWPRLSNPGLVVAAYVFFLALDFVGEMFMLTFGFYTYPGVIPGLTLFYGNYWQFPIYEALLFAATLTGCAALRYFRDDKGRAFVERGVDELTMKPRGHAFVRFLALTGAINVIMFFTYNVAMQPFAIHQSEWPKDITSRSYFMNGLCGPGTDYACPSKDVPIAKIGSSHIAPDGSLQKPADPKD